MLSAAQRVVHGEDRASVRVRHTDRGGELVVLAVLDGHGGDEAVERLHTLLPSVLDEELGRRADPGKALCATFARLADSVRDCASGAACTIVIVVDGREAWSANVGDAQALLVEPSSQTWLTSTHRLDDAADERTAVVARGGQLRRVGSGLHFGSLRCDPGGLAMSRSLGDVDCPCVSRTPSVSCTPIASAHFFVVVASDGVWDALSASTIARRARRHGYGSSDAATQIVDAAWRRSTRDDVSAVVASAGMCARRLSPMSRLFGSSSSMSSEDDAVVIPVRVEEANECGASTTLVPALPKEHQGALATEAAGGGDGASAGA